MLMFIWIYLCKRMFGLICRSTFTKIMRFAVFDILDNKFSKNILPQHIFSGFILSAWQIMGVMRYETAQRGFKNHKQECLSILIWDSSGC